MPSIELDHRRLFSANIGAGAAAKLDLILANDAGVLEGCDLLRQDMQHGRIFVAHIKVDALGLDRPGSDQSPFEHAVGFSLEIEAVFEGARFALVAVDGHQSWRRIAANDRPFSPGRETRPAQSP